MERLTFISHRHADAPIASTISRHLRLWGVTDKEIFQSSSPLSGPRIGEPFSDEILRALAVAKLVILVYTFADEDWSYCMYECGLATDPISRAGTKLVVFQCSTDKPAVYSDHKVVEITDDGIKQFANEMIFGDDFWPGVPAIRKEMDNSVLNDYYTNLYNDLVKEIPEGQLVQINRWDSLTLRMDNTIVKRISSEENEEEAENQIKVHCTVTSHFGSAPKHFGLQDFRGAVALGDLIECWRSNKDEQDKDEWAQSLLVQVRRSIQNLAAVPTFNLMHSARPDVDDMWMHPVLNHVRVLPDGGMEFDLYLYQIPTDSLAKVTN